MITEIGRDELIALGVRVRAGNLASPARTSWWRNRGLLRHSRAVRETGAGAEVIDRLRRGDLCVRATGAAGAAGAFLASQLSRAGLAPAPLLVVCADDGRARAFARDAVFFLGEGDDFGEKAGDFGAPDASPYAEVAPDARAAGARLALLFRAVHGLGPDVLCASAEALLRRTIPRAAFEARCHHVAEGEALDRDAFARRLAEAGYERAPVVQDPGTYAVRGAVVDVFPALTRFPARVEWDGERVESLRLYDPDTQRTLRRVPDLFVHPARETILTGTRLREVVVRAADEAGAPSGRARELLDRLEGRLEGRLESGGAFLGAQGFLPALHDRLDAPVDYLPSTSLVVVDDPAAVAEAARDALDAARDAFLARRAERGVALPPEEHFASLDWLAARRRVEIDPLRGDLDLGARSLDGLAAELRAVRASDDPLAPLRERLRAWRAAGADVVAQVHSSAQADRLRGLLAAHDEVAPELRIGDLGPGFDAGVTVVVADEQIFGPRARRAPGRARRPAARTDLADLAPGDLVVHADHGIGRALGLSTLDAGGIRGDYLHLEYFGGDKLYLPISRLSLVERYRGGDGDVRLDRLGGQTFARRKGKARADAQALAEELLQTYAQRKAAPGRAHDEPDALFAEFEATFPFDETADQERAIAEVLADLCAPRPMDRLVCGDVGFGKTEVALRAAFLVASAGRQVAILAPTTVLVEQHLRTFRERLGAGGSSSNGGGEGGGSSSDGAGGGWPLRVEGLSRFRSRAEAAAILRDLAAGKVDFVVGTHRLLQADVRFRDLGLVVVDEEHRFGVAHKERLKRLRAEVDVLAMTATPIPRTLHLSLGGLRDLSIIATPPEDRLAIRTVLARTDDAVIRDACRRELARGGQVFFVHNRIESIGEWVAKVRELVPEARVGVAHGRLPAAALEQVMVEFVGGALDVLVTTAIIESGLDIPRANTMLVHRADALGLAQLYQLRGRIGRGRERAFCWLLVDSDALPPDARRRLEAVLRHSDLGSGFALATADLDIRGAGELLGPRQSGHVAALGFETYVRVLEEAVAELRGEPIRREQDPEVTLDLPAYIPEAYVEDAGQRLDLYKRLAQARDDDVVGAVVGEMRDRYGAEPEEVDVLARLMACKAAARALGATALDVSRTRVAVAVGDASPLDAGKVAALVQRRPSGTSTGGHAPVSGWKLTPDGRAVRAVPPDEPDRLAFARRALQELAACVRSRAG